MRAFRLASVVVGIVAAGGCSRRALDRTSDAGTIGGIDGAGAADGAGAPDGGTGRVDVRPGIDAIIPPGPLYNRCAVFGWGWPRSIAYSPDGTRLAVQAGRLIQIYEVGSGARVAWYATREQGTGRRFAFLPDGVGIAVAQEDGSTALFRNGLVGTIPGAGLVAASPDGTTLAIVDDAAPSTIALWRITDGTALRTLAGHGAPIRALAFSPDGARLVSGGEDDTTRVWNPADGTSIVIADFDRTVVDIAMVTRDVFATIAQGRGIRFWRLPDGAATSLSVPSAAIISSMSFSADGQLALLGEGSGGGGSNDAVVLRRLSDGKYLWRAMPLVYDQPPNDINDQMSGVALAPDGQSAAANMGPGGIRVYASDGAVVRRIDGALAYQRPLIWPDGSRAAVNDTIYVLLAGTPLLRLTGSIWGISPDGSLVAATTGRIRQLTFSLVKASDGAPAVLLPGQAQVAAFSPDGTVVAYGGRLVRVSDGGSIGTLAGRLDYGVGGIAFSPDGSTLAGAVVEPEAGNTRIVLWNARDGSALRSLGEVDPTASWDGTTSFVDLRFSPDGSQLAAVGRDAKVWNVADGTELGAVPAPPAQNGVFSGGVDPRWEAIALPDPASSRVQLYTLPYAAPLGSPYSVPVPAGSWAISASFMGDRSLVVGSSPGGGGGWTGEVWCNP